MNHPKRIFLIADFKDESPKSIRVQSRMWVKGLMRLGCDVQRFSYRNIMLQASPIPSKRIARRFARKKTDHILCEQISNYQPDVILFHDMKNPDTDTIKMIRDAAPKAILVGRDEDPHPEENTKRLALASKLDMLIHTSAGRFLQTYKDAAVPLCAFIPNMCDPDIQYKYALEKEFEANIMFTGKPEHTRLNRNNQRYELIKRLADLPGTKIYGALGVSRVEGLDYFRAISSAKLGLSINIANDVRLYHSDRFINYISCGTFVLAKRVPDTDLLFEDGKHCRYFETVDEFFELADWYLKHEDERKKIADAGMKHAHQQFNCTKIAKLFLDLIEKGDYDAPWKVIL